RGDGGQDRGDRDGGGALIGFESAHSLFINERSPLRRPWIFPMSTERTYERSYDVVVIGAGITGLSARFHLARLGVKRVASAAPRRAQGRPRGTLTSLLTGGQIDNFTRVSHAHGAAFGAALWRFGDQGFEALLQFCHSYEVACAAARRIRLITSPA